MSGGVLLKVIDVGLLKVAVTIAPDCEGAIPKNRFWPNVLPVKLIGDTVITAVVPLVLPAPLY